MKKFNAELMTLARERAGMSQSTLAKALAVTQATVSRYESGLNVPPDEHVETLAQVLDRPVGFFYLTEHVYGASSLFHRKRKSLTMREEKRIHAQVNELRIRASILLREAEIRASFAFHRLDLVGADHKPRSPEWAAQKLRQLWSLPMGPVRSVVGAIERAGGLVFRCGFGTDKLDGISQWPLDSGHVPPVLFVSEEIPGDRERWTLAHELGHVVMHHLPTDSPETEANVFASEFLMPGREIGPELSRLTLPKAAALKSYWRVSMAAIVRRAFDLGKITDRQYYHLNAEMAKRGYKKCEPLPIPAEEPELFGEVLTVHRRAHGRGIAELSELLGMHEHQFREEFWHPSTSLRLAV